MVPGEGELSGHRRPGLQAQFQRQAPTYRPGLPPSRLLTPGASVSPLGKPSWGNKHLHASTGGSSEQC